MLYSRVRMHLVYCTKILKSSYTNQNCLLLIYLLYNFFFIPRSLFKAVQDDIFQKLFQSDCITLKDKKHLLGKLRSIWINFYKFQIQILFLKGLSTIKKKTTLQQIRLSQQILNMQVSCKMVLYVRCTTIDPNEWVLAGFWQSYYFTSFLIPPTS